MTRNKRGIHAPNNWGQRTDLDRFLALADTVSHCTMLDGEADLVMVLHAHGLDGIALVRMYLAKWPDHNPEEWAEHCAAEYTRDRGGWTLQSVGAHLTPANEMNLEEEGGGSTEEWYRRINDWLVRWWERFTQLVPGIADRLHFPAFAYGHSDDDATRGYCGMEICRPAIERFAVLDVHPYWFEPNQVADPYHGHRFVLSHALFPTKPIFLSEAGNFAVTRASAPDEMTQWFASLSVFPYVIGATPFIFRDPTGAHALNNWGANLEIEKRIIAIAGGTPPPIGGNVDTDKIKVYFQWSAARVAKGEDPRDVSAFLAHLKALGADWRAPHEYGLPYVEVRPLA